jgi:uncharacterized membrane protein
MSKTLLLVAGILLALGVIFARSRLKRAFQLGAVLYAIVLVARFLVFGVAGDRDSLIDLLTVAAVFFLIWLVAWGGTQAVLRYRERSDRPRR